MADDTDAEQAARGARPPSSDLSLKARYIDWKRSSMTISCLFARMLAGSKARDEHKMATEVVTARSSAPRIAASIELKVKRFIADPKVVGGGLVLEHVNDLELLTEVVLELGKLTGWEVKVSPLKHETAGDLVRISLTRDVPAFGGGTVPSEVLVFGDFEPFAATRRAPVTALELYTGVARQFDPKDGMTPATKANLAHIEMPALNAEMMQRTMDRTGELRRMVLGGDDQRAKAKTSLVIPQSLAEKLGCTS